MSIRTKPVYIDGTHRGSARTWEEVADLIARFTGETWDGALLSRTNSEGPDAFYVATDAMAEALSEAAAPRAARA